MRYSGTSYWQHLAGIQISSAAIWTIHLGLRVCITDPKTDCCAHLLVSSRGQPCAQIRGSCKAEMLHAHDMVVAIFAPTACCASPPAPFCFGPVHNGQRTADWSLQNHVRGDRHRHHPDICPPRPRQVALLKESQDDPDMQHCETSYVEFGCMISTKSCSKSKFGCTGKPPIAPGIPRPQK